MALLVSFADDVLASIRTRLGDEHLRGLLIDLTTTVIALLTHLTLLFYSDDSAACLRDRNSINIIAKQRREVVSQQGLTQAG
jgi:hypothetical protein